MPFNPKYSAAALRQSFLDYFAKHGHAVVRSSPLLPANDPTLLFTNAGMNQFKDLFLGKETRVYVRAASSQKCVRAGGKHNDLENVGYTPRHHTFFEMLGNFSFGDYFKKEAIPLAWELLTKEWGIDPDSLHATVFEGGEGLPADDEAYDLWHKTVGIPKERIWKLSAKDNFWEMGETGPCGPCSEIHLERKEKIECAEEAAGKKCLGPACDCDRFMEIWNLVFMQFYRGDDRKLTPLPKPNIDTGMGLERVAQILQGVKSNYDIDLFQNLIAEIGTVTGKKYGAGADSDTALRVIADHIRATTFLIADGIVPSNEGRGYVLRKIMRRALRYGRNLGMQESFLYKLVSPVVTEMGTAFPEITEHQAFIADTVKREEETFARTLALGLNKFEEVILKVAEFQALQDKAKGSLVPDSIQRKLDEHQVFQDKIKSNQIPGAALFKLYDTYGFPLDLAEEIARERKLEVDRDGFKDEMEKQKTMARASWKGEDKAGSFAFLKAPGAPQIFGSRFCGYELLTLDYSKVTEILVNEKPVMELSAGQTGWVFFYETPFYAESGGQVGDTGHLSGDWGSAAILDTKKPLPGLIAHQVKVNWGTFTHGAFPRMEVDPLARRGSVSHHDATHLLHAALRKILGTHVKQAGSLVAPAHLRFDFSHYNQVDSVLLREIEQLVNQEIMANHAVETSADVPIDQALKMGAIALFGEKYGDKVRVVKMGEFSIEFCGGTHGKATGEIGPFKILSERAVAAGTRRIEAVAGPAALARIQHDFETLKNAASLLNAPEDQVYARLESLRDSQKLLEKQISELKQKLASGGSAAADEIKEAAGIRYIARAVDGLESNEAKQVADELRGKVKSGVVVLGISKGAKASLLVALTPDLVGKLDAGKIIRELAPLIGGGGGGRKDIAEAGGKSPEKIPEALAAVGAVIEKMIG